SESRLAIDPSRATEGLPDARVLADFDSGSAWQVWQGGLPQPLTDVLRPRQSGEFAALELSWEPQPRNITSRAIIPNTGDEVLPVLASQGFLRSSGLQVGDTTLLFVNSLFVQSRIVGDFSLFPTLGDTRNTPAL